MNVVILMKPSPTHSLQAFVPYLGYPIALNAAGSHFFYKQKPDPRVPLIELIRAY